MKDISLRELLEAGCHFGHHAERWNPKAYSFIYGEKNGIHIINLELTKKGLEEAGAYLKKIASEGKTILFVATKKQARPIMREITQKYGLMSFIERWPGGFLTNFDQVAKNFKTMDALEKFISEATEKKLNTKKEVLMANKKLKKLMIIYGSVRGLKSLPDCLVVVDIKKEQKTIEEAKRRGVKTIGLVDTNADPREVDISVPTNDDAVGAIRYMLEYLGEAVVEGRNMIVKNDDKSEIRSTKSEINSN